MILSIFLENSVKSGVFCSVDLYPPWGPKKNQPWRVIYQMKGNDFSIRPFNILD